MLWHSVFWHIWFTLFVLHGAFASSVYKSTCTVDPGPISVQLPLNLLLSPELHEGSSVLYPLSLFSKLPTRSNSIQLPTQRRTTGMTHLIYQTVSPAEWRNERQRERLHPNLHHFFKLKSHQLVASTYYIITAKGVIWCIFMYSFFFSVLCSCLLAESRTTLIHSAQVALAKLVFNQSAWSSAFLESD